MEVIAFMLLVIFIAIIIMVNVFYRSAKKNQQVQSYVLPELGIQDDTPEFKQKILTIIRHLEASLDLSYVLQIKDRMIREHKISEAEWENRWFEWKRFIILTTITDQVPMYSREVDEIWHEMSMLSSEYDEFTNKFFGRSFQYSSQIPSEGINHKERAWFDCIYGRLFRLTDFSQETWGPFFKYSFPQEITEDFAKQSMEHLENRYFRKDLFTHINGLQELIVDIISSIRQSTNSGINE